VAELSAGLWRLQRAQIHTNPEPPPPTALDARSALRVKAVWKAVNAWSVDNVFSRSKAIGPKSSVVVPRRGGQGAVVGKILPELCAGLSRTRRALFGPNQTPPSPRSARCEEHHTAFVFSLPSDVKTVVQPWCFSMGVFARCFCGPQSCIAAPQRGGQGADGGKNTPDLCAGLSRTRQAPFGLNLSPPSPAVLVARGVPLQNDHFPQ
jgi:hypothetical protein